MIRYPLLKIISKGTCAWPSAAAFFIEPQEDYLRVGRDPGERQATYRDLFRVRIDPEMLKGIRQAIQANRVFGADYFQTQIEATVALRIAKQKPGPRRGETTPR